MRIFELIKGSLPILISMPHQGTQLPPEMIKHMTPAALKLADTDWHLDLLYAFANELGASILRPYYSRYTIDLNRRPDNTNLYPEAKSTELCPLTTFQFEPIYNAGAEPDAAEIAHRLDMYWRPYHDELQSELLRIRNRSGIAVLFEAHSICSMVPRFFEGALPDLNIGTNDGLSCSPAMQKAAIDALSKREGYTMAVNKRFKGGYITRAYGKPQEGTHAIQLELTQRTYMDETPPYTFRPELAQDIQPVLKRLLKAILDWIENQ